MPAQQATNWIITDYSLNVEKYLDLIQREPNVRYCVWQKERCPKTGRDHIQAFIQLKVKKTMTFVKSLVGDNPHLEKAKKVKCDDNCKLAQADWEAGKDTEHAPCVRHYCCKVYTRTEGPWEIGEHAPAGTRSDLLEVQDAIKAGATYETIADDYFDVTARHSKFFKEYISMKAPRRNWEMEIWVFYGPTGQGKTKAIYDLVGYGKDVFEVKDDKNYPFTGYDAQEKIIWDEFSGSSCDIKYLLRIMDRYPLQVRGLHAYYEFVGKRLIISSNIAPWDWYTKANVEHVKALARRLTEFGKIIEFKDNDTNQKYWHPSEVVEFVDEQGNKGVKYVPANAGTLPPS